MKATAGRWLTSSGQAGKPPDQITSPDVLGWAHTIGLSGRTSSAITVGARVACLSSFYKFLTRMGVVPSNPCDALERPKIQTSPARGYTAADVQKILAAIPDTVAGRRDRAIILTLVLTGRRRPEVINLKAKGITANDERGVTSATFYNRLHRYMVAAGLPPQSASTSSATRRPSCAGTRASPSSR